MGKVITLLEATANLAQYASESLIYAQKPWSPESIAYIDSDPNEGVIPPLVQQLQLSPFIEIDIGTEFISDWVQSLDYNPSNRDICIRLIQYAIHDA